MTGSPYLTAWFFVAGAGLCGVIALYFLTRRLPWPLLRRLLRWVIPVLLLVPAPVPGYEGNYAPAFIVFVFEALFQRDGQPGQALMVLSLAVSLVLTGIVVGQFFGRRRAPGPPPADA